MSAWLGLDEKRVLVAGSGAIGSAVARGFVDAGAAAVVLDADSQRLKVLSEETRLTGTILADLSSGDSCRRAARDAVALLGGLDVFVHCIGINRRVGIEEYTDGEWMQFLDVNLSSAFWLSQAVLPTMRSARNGRILFFSSVAGRMAHRHHGPYAATKAGLDQLARVIANEVAGDGITANTIAPGYTETNLTSEHLADAEVRRQLLSLIPTGRFGTVEELVGPVLFLASPHAGFITGHVLYVDGGRTLV